MATFLLAPAAPRWARRPFFGLNVAHGSRSGTRALRNPTNRSPPQLRGEHFWSLISGWGYRVLLAMRWLFPFALAGLLLGACGGDDDLPTPSTAPERPSATPSPSTAARPTATLAATSAPSPAASPAASSTPAPATAAPAATLLPPTPSAPLSAGVTATADFRWSPEVVEIGAGGTVSWQWASTEPHNIAGQGFELHDPTTNGSFSFTFSAPGTYFYNCVVHPQMDGQVVVR